MFRKTAILGLVLLLGAASLFCYTFYKQRQRKHLQQKLREDFRTRLSKLEHVAGDKIDTSHLTGMFYDEHPEQTEEEFRKQEEARGLILTLSGVLALTGGSVVGLSLLVGAIRLFVKGLYSLAKLLGTGSQTAKNSNEPAQSLRGVGEGQQDGKSKPLKDSAEKTSGSARREPVGSTNSLKVLAASGWESLAGKNRSKPEGIVSETDVSAQDKANDKDHVENTTVFKDKKQHSIGSFMKKLKTEPKADPAVLLCDEESVQLEEPLEHKKYAKPKSASPEPRESSLKKQEDPLTVKTEGLEKKMAEFEQMAARQAASEQSRPLENSLKELTEQMSAIREYAAHQQERVSKLQNGYDWSIVKNFCMRIIRCIDNLESRISTKVHGDADTTDLAEVKDELIFALESTGVEQFEPEVHSDYRGQEKNTEAVKDKQGCDDPKLTGKIAQVIRPGYHYLIDEENVKVVRTAQVKLYE